ncbi:MAG: OmpH family outer membrane protein [Bacteroidales bacterium]|jgi:outer membrane protein|nr:OmpH family outer membrane protein [Bacteroidales bacterium]
MKRLFLILAAVISLGISANAQKFGHIDTQEIINVMPENKAAQETLENEGKKIETQYQAMATEYQNKVQAYQENVQLADAAPEKWSAAIRADKEQEIMQLQERIQRFQENAQQTLQQKRSELFQPVMDKLDAAIKKVATAGGFIYVYDKNSVLFINESLSTDLTSTVKTELGIK